MSFSALPQRNDNPAETSANSGYSAQSHFQLNQFISSLNVMPLRFLVCEDHE